jgi:catechol 2,3-dioxygenase-like lactoylglutathione lyase family enzyme
MLRIGSIVLNVTDLDRAAGFWAGALGYTAAAANPAFLRDVRGAGPRLHLDETDRTHLDLWVDSAQEQAAEVERLVGLGAHRVDWDYPRDADFVVLADPEGNLFCVVNAAPPRKK